MLCARSMWLDHPAFVTVVSPFSFIRTPSPTVISSYLHIYCRPRSKFQLKNLQTTYSIDDSRTLALLNLAESVTDASDELQAVQQCFVTGTWLCRLSLLGESGSQRSSSREGRGRPGLAGETEGAVLGYCPPLLRKPFPLPSDL